MSDFVEQHRTAIFAGLCALITLGAVVFAARQAAPPEPIKIILPEPTAVLPTATPGPLRVYVAGAVVHPDVYTLPPGSIARDALLAAGGATADADLLRINLAQPLSDGQQITVPRLGEVLAPSPVPTSTAGAPGSGPLVNLNTATIQELDALPGIGPTLAQNIVDYRTQHGPFKSVDDLDKVSGIGASTVEKLRGLVTVGP